MRMVKDQRGNTSLASDPPSEACIEDNARPLYALSWMKQLNTLTLNHFVHQAQLIDVKTDVFAAMGSSFRENGLWK